MILISSLGVVALKMTEKFKYTLLWFKMFVFSVSSCPVFSPGAPTTDANTLDNVDAKLTDVHEEENKESERAVAPAEREKKNMI